MQCFDDLQNVLKTEGFKKIFHEKIGLGLFENISIDDFGIKT